MVCPSFGEGTQLRRADRLLQIIQALRRATGPTTARALADELEVVPRTIYRDIATLQASRVPIDGEAGVGYMLRPGYDLPPLMFDTTEIEAVALGLAMVVERGDDELARGASDALAKIRAVVPEEVASTAWKAMQLIPHPLEEAVKFGAHLPAIRKAIRDSRKLRIAYSNAKGRNSERTIWPLGLYLYSHVTLVCTWCEERQDFRAFRSERILSCKSLEDRFDGKNGTLMKEFLTAFQKQSAVLTSAKRHFPPEADVPESPTNLPLACEVESN
jgi:predicted DNA-binding transcriptional regulator YafY